MANNLMSLGASLILGSVKGNDPQGDILLGVLRESGISTDQIVTDPGRDTIVKTRIIAHTQQVARLDRENKTTITDEIRKELIKAVKERIHTIDAIIVSDYAKGVVSRELIEELLEIAHENSIPLCIDPKEKNFPCYRDVDLITPNTKELSFGAGINIESYEDLVAAASKIKNLLGCKTLLVTRGEHGMSLFDGENEALDIPTMAQAVYDVTGAGDTVIACFTLAMISGATAREAAIIANKAAGLVVAEVGAASVPRERLFRSCMEEVSG